MAYKRKVRNWYCFTRNLEKSLYDRVRLDFTFSQLVQILYECSWLRNLVVILASQPMQTQPTKLGAKNLEVKQP